MLQNPQVCLEMFKVVANMLEFYYTKNPFLNNNISLEPGHRENCSFFRIVVLKQQQSNYRPSLLNSIIILSVCNHINRYKTIRFFFCFVAKTTRDFFILFVGLSFVVFVTVAFDFLHFSHTNHDVDTCSLPSYSKKKP